LAGKRKSSCNAYCRGLSAPALSDPATSAKVETIIRVLVGEQATEDQQKLAADFASAQAELLLQIRATRAAVEDRSKCRQPAGAATFGHVGPI
jgi:hypothetical protein